MVIAAERTLDGSILVGHSAVRTIERFQAVDPTTGERLVPDFSESGPEHVADACALAAAASDELRDTDDAARAAFLDRIADLISRLGDDLIDRAMAETGLPRARLEGERARTVGQLRLFAGVARGGEWRGLILDAADPTRQPAPKPELRLRHIPVGPVAVFGASNFPLAFSVAGGDTVAALAVGCPVVVKGHPAHPGTGELVARAVLAAARELGMPEGTFSFLPGTTHGLGGALVADPRVRAVGFTGSRAGGLALAAIAAGRREPIPVFAEMSSVNPVLLLPGALAESAEDLGRAFVASLTLGAGQFCTNPGIVVASAGDGLDRFLASASAALADHQPQPMLTAAIHAAYSEGVEALARHAATHLVASGGVGEGVTRARASLFVADSADFLEDPALADEVFGASAVVVRCADVREMREVVRGLPGQLTATLHLTPGDEEAAASLVPLLETKAGRILVNGWPTGVEVSPAMVHGGPYPATTDGRSTSVGTLAAARFVRPVCYQDMPASLLPRVFGNRPA